MINNEIVRKLLLSLFKGLYSSRKSDTIIGFLHVAARGISIICSG